MKPIGSEVTLTVTHGELPPPGDMLVTGSGRCYRVEDSRPSRPDAKRVGVLRCTVIDYDAVRVGQPGVWAWAFDAR